jgi:hypothetical protein
MTQEKEYLATVIKVVKVGTHGPYAIAISNELGSITFSLEKPVWRESSWPDGGTSVMLSQIRRKRAGWRAMSGRSFGPSDSQHQQPARSNEQ